VTNEQSIHTTSSRKPYARLQSCTLVCTPPSLIEYIIHRLLINIYFIECENRREFQIRKITSYPLYVLVCDKSYDSYVYGMALLDLLTTFYDILCYVFPTDSIAYYFKPVRFTFTRESVGLPLPPRHVHPTLSTDIVLSTRRLHAAFYELPSHSCRQTDR
jgi:hypothetical protein